MANASDNLAALATLINEVGGHDRFNCYARNPVTAEEVAEAESLTDLIGFDLQPGHPSIAKFVALGATADEWTHFGSVANETLISLYI